MKFNTDAVESLETIPPALLQHQISSYLDLPSLLNTTECSKQLHQGLVSSSEPWKKQIRFIRRTKFHRGPIQPCRKGVLAAYRDSRRNELTAPDLVVPDAALKRMGLHVHLDPRFDVPIYHFHFKEKAGDYWIQNDPYHQGKPCRRVVFLRDGQVKEVKDGNRLADPDFFAVNTVSWRTVRHPLLDGPERPVGAYIRLIVGDRDVPTYVVRRHENWGFVLESCWGVFTSFPLDKPIEYKISDSLHWREALLYNLGLQSLPCGPRALEIFDQKWNVALEARKRHQHDQVATESAPNAPKRVRLE